MPISSSAGSVNKKKLLKVKNKSLTPTSTVKPTSKTETAGCARTSSTTSLSISSDVDVVQSNGQTHVSRSMESREQAPDRLCLDRQGLTRFPVILHEDRLRLLSLQYNLIDNLDSLRLQKLPTLVFLDLYNNQLEDTKNLFILENLRVLLIGKNRIKKIEGLEDLKRLEVLDLHGNQIQQVAGLGALGELRVLNLAGNQIRCVADSDFEGLPALQELNLRRNQLRKVLGLGPNNLNLKKVYLNNNDIQTIEDVSGLVRSVNITELSLENNPVSLISDSVLFFVSYLSKLSSLNQVSVSEQTKRSALTWRRNKESLGGAYAELSRQLSVVGRREEVITNARTNWEILRTQSAKFLTNKGHVERNVNLMPDSDIILTSLLKTSNVKKIRIKRRKQDSCCENVCRLPPILLPIINKLQEKKESLSSVCPNIDSSVSSLLSSKSESDDESTSSSDDSENDDKTKDNSKKTVTSVVMSTASIPNSSVVGGADSSSNGETASQLSSTNSAPLSTSSTGKSGPDSGGSTNQASGARPKRSVKSATHHKTSTTGVKLHRAVTAKPKRQTSPLNNVSVVREREQGGDYLVEISGRFLNVFGQGSLHFIDKSWNSAKANDVTTINFNYVNFGSLTSVLYRIKARFPNAENFTFKETNIQFLGQLNALAEIQGLTALTIDTDGNPIAQKDWKTYAIYRLSHWGLKYINNELISEDDILTANKKYQSLSDLVLWTLPDVLLQPLLVRLSINIDDSGVATPNVKRWLMTADAALRGVVSKEALQWKKMTNANDDVGVMRQRARIYMGRLLSDMGGTVKKLRLFEERWPGILREIVKNALLDYSQLDHYRRRKLSELSH